MAVRWFASASERIAMSVHRPSALWSSARSPGSGLGHPAWGVACSDTRHSAPLWLAADATLSDRQLLAFDRFRSVARSVPSSTVSGPAVDCQPSVSMSHIDPAVGQPRPTENASADRGWSDPGGPSTSATSRVDRRSWRLDVPRQSTAAGTVHTRSLKTGSRFVFKELREMQFANWHDVRHHLGEHAAKELQVFSRSILSVYTIQPGLDHQCLPRFVDSALPGLQLWHQREGVQDTSTKRERLNRC